MKPKLRIGAAAGLAAALAIAAPPGAAQGTAYPVKPIRMIVASGAGGGLDFVARLVAIPLSEALGQSVVVDNRGSEWHARHVSASGGAAGGWCTSSSAVISTTRDMGGFRGLHLNWIATGLPWRNLANWWFGPRNSRNLPGFRRSLTMASDFPSVRQTGLLPEPYDLFL